MSPDHRPTPATIIGALLTSHPEAASLLAEASHWRALAMCSAVFTRVKFTAAQAARLAYEELPFPRVSWGNDERPEGTAASGGR